MATLPAAFKTFLTGLGYVDPPDAGNRSNAPANPPVQEGSYEYIIPQMFASQDIVNVPAIPPNYQDWAQYPVSLYGLSGLEGGGSTGDVPIVVNGRTLYYNEVTGMYYALNM